MTNKTFSPEEIELLKSNPFTYSVSELTIRFTAAFKEEFWLRRKAGQRLPDIFTDLGYDVDILGASRLQNIAAQIRKQALSTDAFHEKNSTRKFKAGLPNFGDMPSDQALVRMQHELLYMRQELDFIKKIIKADNTGELKP